MDVIAEVRSRQLAENLSDAKFAKKLDISRHMWEAILKGKRQAGYKVWNAIIKTYPDLIDPVLDLVDAKVLQGGKHERRAETMVETTKNGVSPRASESV